MDYKQNMDKLIKNLNFKNKTTFKYIKDSIIKLEKLLDKRLKDITIDDFSDVKYIYELLICNYSADMTLNTLSKLKKLLTYINVDNNIVKKYNNFIKNINKKDNTKIIKKFDYEDSRGLIEARARQILQDDAILKTDLRTFLIMAFLFLIPPTTIDELRDIKIKYKEKLGSRGDNLPKKYNYVIRLSKNKYELILNNNSSKSIDSIQYNIESELLNKLIEKYLKSLNKSNLHSQFLFLNVNNNRLKRYNYNIGINIMGNKLLGRNININTIRRGYLKTIIYKPLMEKLTLAKKIGNKQLDISRLYKGEYIIEFF